MCPGGKIVWILVGFKERGHIRIHCTIPSGDDNSKAITVIGKVEWQWKDQAKLVDPTWLIIPNGEKS
jgi:hypothetical protein